MRSVCSFPVFLIFIRPAENRAESRKEASGRGIKLKILKDSFSFSEKIVAMLHVCVYIIYLNGAV